MLQVTTETFILNCNQLHTLFSFLTLHECNVRLERRVGTHAFASLVYCVSHFTTYFFNLLFHHLQFSFRAAMQVLCNDLIT